MQFSLQKLHYVVAVADTQSVTKAARTLNISQPTISSALQSIETALGVQLFLRHHARGVTMTVAGRRFVNEARLLVKQARDFEHNIASLGQRVMGDISVGAFVTLATRYMPGLLTEFSRQMPGITVRLEEGNQQQIVDGLVNGRLELAMSYSYSLPPEIEGQPLATLPPYLLLPADHPLAEQSAVSLRQIATEPFILLDLPHSRDYFMNLFTACGVLPQVIYRSQSYELIRGLVGHSRGYTIHNALPGNARTYDGKRIAARPILETLPPVKIMCLHLGQQSVRPSVAAFADFLQVAFSKSGMYGASAGLAET